MECAVETIAGQRGSGCFDTPRPRVPPSGIPRVPCANCAGVHMSARPGSPPVGSGTPPLRSHRPAVVTSHANQLIDRQHAVRAQSDKLPGCGAPLGCIADQPSRRHREVLRTRASTPWFAACAMATSVVAPRQPGAAQSTTDSADTPAARIPLNSTNGPTAAFLPCALLCNPMTQVWTCPAEPVTSAPHV